MDNSTTAPIYHFKILVPAAAAGRIIGKGGTTIAQLQKIAGARVKMSKASEFYPGTTERVCLISGPIEGILKINDFFMENFSTTSIKILVPNSTAGMIIGKGGSYIKQIKEDSGAYVQISQKCPDLALPERCVTIVGELENIRRACTMILCKIVEDAGSAYSRDNCNRSSSILVTTTTPSTPTTTPTPSLPSKPSTPTSATAINHTMSGIITTNHSNSINNSNNNINNNNNNSISIHNHTNSNNNAITTTTNTTTNTATATNLTRMTNSPTSLSNLMPSSILSDMNSDQIIESIKLVLTVSGYGEEAVSEITSAMSTLASYGVLGIGLGLL